VQGARACDRLSPLDASEQQSKVDTSLCSSTRNGVPGQVVCPGSCRSLESVFSRNASISSLAWRVLKHPCDSCTCFQGLELSSREPGVAPGALSGRTPCILGAGTLSFELEYFCRDETGVRSETELSRESRSFVPPEEALSLSKSSKIIESRRSEDVNEVPEPRLRRPFFDNG
jgi:hypothetical protein